MMGHNKMARTNMPRLCNRALSTMVRTILPRQESTR
jgi:hypothetical protein